MTDPSASSSPRWSRAIESSWVLNVSGFMETARIITMGIRTSTPKRPIGDKEGLSRRCPIYQHPSSVTLAFDGQDNVPRYPTGGAFALRSTRLPPGFPDRCETEVRFGL